MTSKHRAHTIRAVFFDDTRCLFFNINHVYIALSIEAGCMSILLLGHDFSNILYSELLNLTATPPARTTTICLRMHATSNFVWITEYTVSIDLHIPH